MTNTPALCAAAATALAKSVSAKNEPSELVLTTLFLLLPLLLLPYANIDPEEWKQDDNMKVFNSTLQYILNSVCIVISETCAR